MPNIRIFGTDANGNNTLIRTVVCDKNINVIEVIDHTDKDRRDKLSASIAERAKSAFDDFVRQNPVRALRAVEQIEAEQAEAK